MSSTPEASTVRTNVLARPKSTGCCRSRLTSMLSKRSAVLEHRAIGELGVAIAGDELLDDHLLAADDGRSLADASRQLLARVGSPRLALGRVEEPLLDRRLDHVR